MPPPLESLAPPALHRRPPPRALPARTAQASHSAAQACIQNSGNQSRAQIMFSSCNTPSHMPSCSDDLHASRNQYCNKRSPLPSRRTVPLCSLSILLYKAALMHPQPCSLQTV